MAVHPAMGFANKEFMAYRTPLLSAWTLTLSLSVNAADSPIQVGLQESLRLPGQYQSVWVADGKILSARAHLGQVWLVGKKLGETVVLADRKALRVRVIPLPDRRLAYEFQKIADHAEGLRIRHEDEGLTINGSILREIDWLEMAETQRRVGGQYLLRASVAENVWTSVKARMSRELKSAGLPPINLIPDRLPDTDIPDSLKPHEASYRRLLSPYGLRPNWVAYQREVAPLVRLKILFAEVSRGFERQFGVAWPQESRWQIMPRLQDLTDWTALIKLIESDQVGRVLATPSLLCRSGAEAEFLAGGEIPIRVGTKSQANVSWRKHGVLLRFRPLTDAAGGMRIHLVTEFSLPDFSSSVDGIPGIKSNRVESEFDLNGPRTILLSGLVRESMGHSKQGLPYLSQLPVLGEAFSQSHFQEGRSEVIVLVQPEIIDGALSD